MRKSFEFITAHEIGKMIRTLGPKLTELLTLIGKDIDEPVLQPEDTVYQYTDLNALIGIIEHGEIWATSMEYLNDASEYHHGLQVCKDALDGIDEPFREELKHVLSVMPVMMNDLISERDDVFVSCFSANGDQLGQWRGYAANGFGYAIGFDTLELTTKLKPSTIPLNVIYKKTSKENFGKAFFLHAPPLLRDVLATSNIRIDERAIAGLMVFFMRATIPLFKHEGFMEENEFRLIVDTGVMRTANDLVKYHMRNGLIVPHIPLKISPEKLPIRRIYVGPNLNFKKASKSLGRFLRDRGYNTVEIVESSIPYVA